MVHETSQPEKEIRSVRFPGIMRDARRLGVHRNHLYLVLTGNRQSPGLLNRYKKLHKERS